MIPTLASAPDDLQILKVYLLDFTGLDRDALHLHAGLALFILVRIVWRRRGGWVIAWLAALTIALGVEWLDIRADGTGGAPLPQPEHWHDIWNTMIWPTVLLLVGPWLQPKKKIKPPPSGDLADQTFEESAPI
jgi:hypothetical protein